MQERLQLAPKCRLPIAKLFNGSGSKMQPTKGTMENNNNQQKYNKYMLAPAFVVLPSLRHTFTFHCFGAARKTRLLFNFEFYSFKN